MRVVEGADPYRGLIKQTDKSKLKNSFYYKFEVNITLEIQLCMVYNDKKAEILAFRERIPVLGVYIFVTK